MSKGREHLVFPNDILKCRCFFLSTNVSLVDKDWISWLAKSLSFMLYIRVNFKRTDRWVVINIIYDNINYFINGYISE